MTLSSMTGFARAQDSCGPWRYAWEIKTVNSKGLDLRLRAPSNFDALEIKARARIAARIARGACFANLTARRDDASGEVRINRAALDKLLKALDDVPLHAALRPASLDGLLSVRGIVEFIEPEEDEASRNARDDKILATLEQALDALVASRNGEGAALAKVLTTRLDRICDLAAKADSAPGRSVEAIRARLAQQLAALLENSSGFDAQRLHQEAALLAVRADIREELDRLAVHVASARALLASGGPVGRRLDFLAQELARESNTLCAKSNDPSLAAIGLDLKTEVEQWREQAQNIE
ncbi:MAG: YicC family protein [Methylocystis sp.]|nr:YicC family protein [Methylocystis sp.]